MDAARPLVDKAWHLQGPCMIVKAACLFSAVVHLTCPSDAWASPHPLQSEEFASLKEAECKVRSLLPANSYDLNFQKHFRNVS